MTVPIGVGVVGSAWITRVHAQALTKLNSLAPLSREIRLTSVYGRREGTVSALAGSTVAVSRCEFAVSRTVT